MKNHAFLCRRALAALLVIALLAGSSVSVSAAGGFRYIHDPAQNPSAMRDIVADETAVYGYRPTATGSLAVYADADWSDPGIVEEGRQERIKYHQNIESMYDMLREMQQQGKTTEEIARAVSTERNRIRLASAANNPEKLAALKERNLEEYGHEEGPLPDELYEKYGSWTIVMQKAFSTNAGMDACLGLYDTYYFIYVELGYVPAQVEISIPATLGCKCGKPVSIETQIVADATNYTVRFVSDDPDVAAVNDNGVVTGVKRGETDIRCLVTDAFGMVHTSQACRVQVRYTFRQWIIRIFFFGWAWYKPKPVAA